MARNSNTKYPNKREGEKVKVQFTCGEYKTGKMGELDDALSQINQHRSIDDQVVVTDNMRMLLRHLEGGEIFYVTQMAISPVMINKPLDIVTTLKTFLKGEERLWVIYHKETTSYVWKAVYTSVRGNFSDFLIYSCDTVTLLA